MPNENDILGGRKRSDERNLVTAKERHAWKRSLGAAATLTFEFCVPIVNIAGRFSSSPSRLLRMTLLWDVGAQNELHEIARRLIRRPAEPVVRGSELLPDKSYRSQRNHPWGSSGVIRSDNMGTSIPPFQASRLD